MPQPIHHDQDDTAEVILGVDTHKDLHAAAVINLDTHQQVADAVGPPGTALGAKDDLKRRRTEGAVRRSPGTVPTALSHSRRRRLRDQQDPLLDVLPR
jgi:hypothetical protein